MNKDKKTAIQFLKELDSEIANLLNEFAHVELMTVRIFNQCNEFIEANSDITRSEAFKNLEKDIKTLYQSCRFISNDAVDVRHSIADCSTELN